MKRVYILCSSQFVQLVLPVPEDCRSEGAEAVRDTPVVVPELPAVARLEFRLQNTNPSDPNWLPSNRGEEGLVLQPVLSAVVACPRVDPNWREIKA